MGEYRGGLAGRETGGLELMLQAAILAITRVAGQRTQRELNPGSRGPSGSLRSLDTGPSRHLQEDTRKRRPTGCPGVQGPPALQGSAG